MIYIHVIDNQVVNVIVWDGEAPYEVAEGTLEPAPESVGVGWVLTNGEWINPLQAFEHLIIDEE